jgi:hypothetical protein
MIWWTIKWIIISLTLIALLHYLYSFFKNALTVPKIRDLVNKPNESYNEIMNTIKTSHAAHASGPAHASGEQHNDDDSMHDELKNFLSELKKPKNSDNNNSVNNNNSFSNNNYNTIEPSTFSNTFSTY